MRRSTGAALLALPLLLVLGAPARAAAPVRKGQAQVRGLKLYYEVRGKGPALLLMHGGGGSSARFATLAPRLAKQFTVITPDMRGRGRSTDLDEPFTYDAMAADMVALLDALGVKRAHAMGWSDGGVVALTLALRHPHRIERVVAFGANGRPDGLNAKTRAWLETLPDAWKDDGAYAKVAPNPGHWPVVVQKLKVMWQTLPRYDAQTLSRITAPVLIAAGDQDDITLEHTVELYRQLPNAQLLVMPGAGHSMKKQDLELVVREVTRFLTAPPAAR